MRRWLWTVERLTSSILGSSNMFQCISLMELSTTSNTYIKTSTMQGNTRLEKNGGRTMRNLETSYKVYWKMHPTKTWETNQEKTLLPQNVKKYSPDSLSLPSFLVSMPCFSLALLARSPAESGEVIFWWPPFTSPLKPIAHMVCPEFTHWRRSFDWHWPASFRLLSGKRWLWKTCRSISCS